MSVIAYVKKDNKIIVASDGLAVSGSTIKGTEVKKVGYIGKEILYGVTGLVDSIEMFENFIKLNIRRFIRIYGTTDILKLMNEFKEYCKDEYGYTDDYIREFGTFMIVTKCWRCFVCFDDENGNVPYIVDDNLDHAVAGCKHEYIEALLDVGYDIEKAIKTAAKKSIHINDKVTTYTLDLYE